MKNVFRKGSDSEGPGTSGNDPVFFDRLKKFNRYEMLGLGKLFLNNPKKATGAFG